MKKSILLIVLVALSVTTAAHAQWSKIKGNGKIVTEKRTTSEYDEINVAGFFDVELVSGKEGAIIINAEENLLPYIKIEVKDNILKIYTGKKHKYKHQEKYCFNGSIRTDQRSYTFWLR